MSGRYAGEPMSSARSISLNANLPTARKGGNRGPAPLLTDQQILEVRALAQFAGWGCDRLSSRYGVDNAMIQRVVSGVTRSRLVATLRHLPDGVKPI